MLQQLWLDGERDIDLSKRTEKNATATEKNFEGEPTSTDYFVLTSVCPSVSQSISIRPKATVSSLSAKENKEK